MKLIRVSRKSHQELIVPRNSLKGPKLGHSELNPCQGRGLKLHDRDEKYARYRKNSCRRSLSVSTDVTVMPVSISKHDDWISEYYRKCTETDSYQVISHSVRHHRTKDTKYRRGSRVKCLTPEPESHFYGTSTRRVLILDLRKLKSVDVQVRQDSLTSTATLSGAEADEDIMQDSPKGHSPSPTELMTSTSKSVLHQLPLVNEGSTTSPNNLVEESNLVHGKPTVLMSQEVSRMKIRAIMD